MFCFKNWKKICEEKDKRIADLEGKFDEIVNLLEEEQTNCLNAFDATRDYYYYGKCDGLEEAVGIVKGVKND